MTTIAFIGFGEAGGILAADLAREYAVFRRGVRWRRRWRAPR